MNIDDPKLTAFALGELDEPERSAIEGQVAQSPEAQRYVDEMQNLARALKDEFAAEIQNSVANGSPRDESVQMADLRPVDERRATTWLQRRSLSDIHDDPWFWSIGRPLAVAAIVSILAILSAILIISRSRHDSIASPPTDYTSIEGEQIPPGEIGLESIGPEQVSNPWSGEAVRRIDHVVIGELVVENSGASEVRIIETVNDAYRVQHLKERLTVPVLSRQPETRPTGRIYTLMFVDRGGRIVAGTNFYWVTNFGFVLRPLQSAYESAGRYFVGGNAILPGDWKSNVNYRDYAIPFADWQDCIGYAPGV